MPRYRWCTQDSDLQGPQNAITPRLEDHTLLGWLDTGVISARPRTTTTPDATPHIVLPTVFDHCTPAIQGKTTTSTFPYSCTPPLLMTIKGGGGLPLKGDAIINDVAIIVIRSVPLSTRYWHSPQSTSPLAETWELPSLSRLACTPPTTDTSGAR